MSTRETRNEVRSIQRNSDALAQAPLPESADFRPLHQTSTVAVRLRQSDVNAIAALADSQGVNSSVLLRAWILAGLEQESGDSIGATLAELEQGIRRLRKVLG